MFNVSLFDVNIEIKIYHGSTLAVKATQCNTAWMEIEVDNMTGCFDLLGVSKMELDFMDDDYIVFKKSKDGNRVVITISKHDMAKMVGSMLEYLAGTTLSLFGRDED